MASERMFVYAAGMPTVLEAFRDAVLDRFPIYGGTGRFVGFLPRKRGALLALFREGGETVVAFESPRRVAASLSALAEVAAILAAVKTV